VCAIFFSYVGFWVAFSLPFCNENLFICAQIFIKKIIMKAFNEQGRILLKCLNIVFFEFFYDHQHPQKKEKEKKEGAPPKG
jgi:hypothetical protein